MGELAEVKATLHWYDQALIALYSGVVWALLTAAFAYLFEPRRERRKQQLLGQLQVKTEAYRRAMSLVHRHFMTGQWTGPQVTTGATAAGVTAPTPLEINDCLGELVLVCDNRHVADRFTDFFNPQKQSSPQTRAEFIELLRNDLFETKSKVDAGTLPVVF